MIPAVSIAVLALHFLHVQAFTNGTLIPPYICDLRDLQKGSPQSLGQLIPYLKEDDAQAKIAGYHKVTKVPYAAQDLCTAKFSTGAYSSNAKIQVVTKGGEALIGLIVWVQDFPPHYYGNPRRIGEWTSTGSANMMLYPYRCGQTLVHATTLDDDATVKSESSIMSWMAPKCGVFGGKIQVRGVCVTDNGFGKFAVDLPTNATDAAEEMAGTHHCREEQTEQQASSGMQVQTTLAIIETTKPVAVVAAAAVTTSAMSMPATGAAVYSQPAGTYSMGMTPLFATSSARVLTTVFILFLAQTLLI